MLLTAATAGCGGSDSPEASAGGRAQLSVPSSPPEITVPAGLPPRKLVIKDLREGTGREAKRGDEVTIQYNGVIWKSGDEQGSSWEFPSPPTFVLGERRLQRGLNLGIPGMREGGIRELLVPPRLVYYPNIRPPKIARLDARIYRVYLLEVIHRKSQL